MQKRARVAWALSALILTACSGSSGESPAAQASRTSSPSSPAVALPSPSVVGIDPSAPLTQTYTTTLFKPPLTVKLPAGWFPTERDVAAFQVYVGDEDYEITFDHSYTGKESVDGAVERLKKAEGIQAGRVSAVSVGGRASMAFVASRPGTMRLTFSDSGFHVPGGSDLEVMAVPLPDGTTLTVFVGRRVDDGVTRPLEPMRRVARRILATVTWR
jgi:hypothetical protein